MKSERELELIERYVDRELDNEERKAFEEDLGHDPELGRLVEFQRSLKALVAAAYQESAPAEIATRIETRLEQVEQGRVDDLIECFVDGELDEQESELFDRVLKESAELSRRVDFQKSLKGMVEQSQQPVQAPQALRAKLLAALEAESQSQPWSFETVEAWVDGEEPKLVAPTDPESERRIAFQTNLKGLVAEAYRDQKAPELTRKLIEKRLASGSNATPLIHRVARGMAWAASFAVVVLFAAIATSGPNPTAARELAEAVGTDHQVCCRFSAKNPDANPVEFALEHFGQSPTLAQLPERYQLYDVRSCLLPNKKRALHVLYADAGGSFVSLFGFPDQDGLADDLEQAHQRDLTVHSVDTGQVQVASWSRDGWVYSVAGEMPRHEFEDILQQADYTVLHQLELVASLF